MIYLLGLSAKKIPEASKRELKSLKFQTQLFTLPLCLMFVIFEESADAKTPSKVSKYSTIYFLCFFLSNSIHFISPFNYFLFISPPFLSLKKITSNLFSLYVCLLPSRFLSLRFLFNSCFLSLLSSHLAFFHPLLLSLSTFFVFFLNFAISLFLPLFSLIFERRPKSQKPYSIA